MTGAAAVLVCALDLLGKTAASLPPIELLTDRPADVSATAEGFVRPGRPVIYLITSSRAFREANCRNRGTLAKLASVVMHEAWHLEHGPDERGAYEAQLYTLLRLGATTDSLVYQGVRRSMRFVLKTQEQDRQTLAKARPAQAPPEVTILAAGERVP